MTITLTLSASSLRALVSPVIPLAGKGIDHPIFAAVHLRSRGEYVTATATDRYRLGIQRVKVAAPRRDWRTASAPRRCGQCSASSSRPARRATPS